PTVDLSRVFVATDRGVAVIDAFTLQQFDVDPATASMDLIPIPGGITALALDPSERYLYAAGVGAIHVIDLLQTSKDWHRVADVIGGFSAPNAGRINDLAVNSDGKRLFVAVPHTSLFGANGWVGGGRDKGEIVVINVDESDRPAEAGPNLRKWREVISTLDGGMEPWSLEPTLQRDKLLFTSRLDLRSGLHTIVIDRDDPLAFKATVRAVNLTLNQETVGVSYIAGDGYFPNLTTRLHRQQVFDLDVRNASAVAITPDLRYAFVGDYYVPRYYYTRDTQLAFDIEELHEVGSKVGVVRDPFGLEAGVAAGSGRIIAATTPIPMSFLSELELDGSGRKLYANFRGIGNVTVYDVDEMTARALNTSLKYAGNIAWSRQPLDGLWADEAAGSTINLDPIDTERYSQGLALQSVNVLTLIRPSGPIDTDAADDSRLVFEWETDAALLGADAIGGWTTRLYLSSQMPGHGLWPNDPWRDRPEPGLLGLAQKPAALGPTPADTNPGRIFTAPVSLKIGMRYLVTAGPTGYTVKENGAAADPKRTVVEIDAAVRKALTAGQIYYWGVELEKAGQRVGIRQGGAFTAQPVTTTTPYSTVTVLTHGFQLNPFSSLTGASGQFEQPQSFLDMAKLVVQASGGGVVLSYDKHSGLWVDRSRWNGYGTPPSEAVGMAAIVPGKAVVLVSDWSVESDISDSGFSEAAADAIFASILDLDRQTGGKLLVSPMHFIGHSRGTVVNSEIIQRLGASGKVTTGIQMTTLDPHDFDQKSLDIPLGKLAKEVQEYIKLIKAGGIVGGYFFPPAYPAIMSAVVTLNRIDASISSALKLAKTLGISTDIRYGDFLDPNVQVWENVSFADNYWQKAADEPQASSLYFTATPNGRPLDPEPTPVKDKPKAPPVFKAGETAADIDLWLDGLAGFGFEDLEFALGRMTGVGGPHSRVWQWYAGTINTGLLEFGDMPIWRTAGDQGLATEVFGFIPLPNSPYSEQSWYVSNPYRIVRGSAAERLTYLNSGTGLANDIREGISTGWFFSALGG
ncbi:MAG: hypothetical protein RIS35_3792, partial [Pseudomonadota bacterium]